MKYFRIKIGFGKGDFISIDETELGRAILAQVTGRVALFKAGAIAGNQILAILPDYQREMGWNRDWQLTGVDYREMGSKRINEYEECFERVQEEIRAQLGSGSSSEQKRLE